jgi:hypothetical protein
MWKKDTTIFLDVVRFLSKLPFFPHTCAPTSSKTVSLKILIIYLNNINQKPIISPSQNLFSKLTQKRLTPSELQNSKNSKLHKN